MSWKVKLGLFAGIGLIGGALTPTPSHAFLDNLMRSLTTCPPNSTAAGCQGQPRTARPAAPSQAQIAAREERRAIQGALNSFGFDAGTPDGVFGPRTRSAVSAYQEVIGAPTTGELTADQQRVLIDTEAAMQAGAVQGQDAIMAQEGPRGLLRAAVDPTFAAQFAPQQPPQSGAQPLITGLAPLPMLTPAAPLTSEGARAPLPVLTPTTPQGAENAGTTPLPGLAPLPELTPSGRSAQTAGLAPLAPLPSLVPRPVAMSIAGRCAQVEAKIVEAGVLQDANTRNPEQALSEQFCIARGAAITEGKVQMATSGVTGATLASACANMKATYSTRLATVPFGSPEQVTEMAQELSSEAGLSDLTKALDFGRMCLSLAYEQDDGPMAISAALVMVAAAETPYGEIVGHHLREGLGLPSKPSVAGQWYDVSMSALEAGATPAFAPESSDIRVEIIRAAMRRGGS